MLTTAMSITFLPVAAKHRRPLPSTQSHPFQQAVSFKVQVVAMLTQKKEKSLQVLGKNLEGRVEQSLQARATNGFIGTEAQLTSLASGTFICGTWINAPYCVSALEKAIFSQYVLQYAQLDPARFFTQSHQILVLI